MNYLDKFCIDEYINIYIYIYKYIYIYITYVIIQKITIILNYTENNLLRSDYQIVKSM